MDRTCGIAPDGTRVAKTEYVPGMPPRGIPGEKDVSHEYVMGAFAALVSPLSEYVG